MMKELLREWPVAALLLNEEGEVAVAFDEAVSDGDSFRDAGGGRMPNAHMPPPCGCARYPRHTGYSTGTACGSWGDW